MMIEEISQESEINEMLSKSISIDADGISQPLSEEQEQWLQENIEEIKEGNDGSIPTKSFFFDYAEYRYRKGREVTQDDFVREHQRTKNRDKSVYYKPETKRWFKKQYLTGKRTLNEMPSYVARDINLVDEVYERCAAHETIIGYLNQSRKKVKK